MGERKFIWNEVIEGISLAGISKLEEDQIKNRGGSKLNQKDVAIFCPHSYLVFNFQEALSTNQEIKFRKHFMRKSESKEHDIVYLQDVKNLVLYLATNRISVQFIDFFHLPIADRFLRALIIYFQYYFEIWEEMLNRRNATQKKIINPLAHGDSLKRENNLNSLRIILAGEYSNLLIGCKYGGHYHHMMTGGKNKPLVQSQHEKDLRIFETLLAVSHQVVWITLQRKFYNLIEIELHRMFRTDSYNTAERRNSELMKNIKESERIELHGPKMRSRRKLLRNSSLPYQLLNSDCDYRLLALDSLTSKDPQIIFFQNALHLEEEKFAELGIKVGILGMPRSNFDHLLLPISESPKKDEDSQNQLFLWKINLEKSFEEIPNARSNLELDLTQEKSKFPSSKRYKKSCRDERRKWIDRAINLAARRQKDTISTTTTTWEHN